MCINLLFVMFIKHLINVLWRKEITLLENPLTWRERGEKEAILSIYTPLLVLWHISSGSTRGDMRVNAYGTCLERYLNKHRCALTATWNLNAFQAWNPSGGKSINSQHHYISKKAFTHHQERVILGLGGIRHPALVLLYNNFPDKEWGKFTDSNESGCKL